MVVRGSKMIKISIIMPVYNVEKYLDEAIKSVLSQSLKELEIICINDASTDKSLAILNKYKKTDNRIKIITYNDNKGPSQARKDGVAMAQGEYIMFLDSDDYLSKDTCEDLYHTIEEKQCDMVHFETNIIDVNNQSASVIQGVEKLIAPYAAAITDASIFEACFVNHKFGFTLWNKIYSAALCKKAFSKVSDGNMPVAEDLYAFFILAYFAKSYYGLTNKKYYNYRLGAGITGRKKMDLQQFERHCKSAISAEKMLEFAQEMNSEILLQVAHKSKEDLIRNVLKTWLTTLDDEVSGAGFDIISEYFDSETIVSRICFDYFKDKKLVATKLNDSKYFNFKNNKKIKTIGIYYHFYGQGGVERVLSLLIPMYRNLGYNVVLFTDEYRPGDEYDLPKDVKRIILPSALSLSHEKYNIRATEFVAELKKHQVDIVCYHAASSPMLLFDLILIKMQKIPVVLSMHEMAFQSFLSFSPEIVNRPSMYRLADVVTVVSNTDKFFWHHFGLNVAYLPNPIDVSLITAKKRKEEKNTIVWLGRLDALTKKYMDTVEIMQEVVFEVPDAKLLIVGSEYTKGAVEQLKQAILKNGLENNIELCGHTNDVSKYYEKASIHLLTSISESFSLTIAESKAYGIPLVMYELPFLEIIKDKRGYLAVPQGNSKMMAKAIIKLLKDDSYRNEMGKEALASLQEFNKFDLAGAWQNVFESISLKTSNNEKKELDAEVEILLKAMLHHYESGFNRKVPETSNPVKKDASKGRAKGGLKAKLRRLYLRLMPVSKNQFKTEMNKLKKENLMMKAKMEAYVKNITTENTAKIIKNQNSHFLNMINEDNNKTEK